MRNRRRHSKRACRLSSKGGFTLLETLLCCLLFALLLGSLLSGLLFLQRALAPARVLAGGEVLSVAPTYSPFPAAVRLQERLMSRLDGAVATYVFGGGHSGLSEVPAGAVTGPLEALFLPRLSGCAAGLPQDAASFHSRYSSELGAQRTDASPSDFSMVIVGTHEGALEATCLVQCRSNEVQLSGEQRPWRKLEVSLRDIDGTVLSYAFVERPGMERTFTGGVMHTWHRLNEARGIFEEGPACVVFPDPWRFAGDAAGSPSGTSFSRFSYFLPLGT